MVQDESSRNKFKFKPKYARRISDPNFSDINKHIFLMNVKDLPSSLPNGANARDSHTNKMVYRKIRDSLLNKDCVKNTFHLKNKGITIIAESVIKSSNGSGLYDVVIDEKKGIVDGGHTYQLITENRENIPDDADDAESQYVQVEIRTGVPDDWISDIAGGLNTGIQVTDMSLTNLSSDFETLKEALGNKLAGLIAWKESDDAYIDARDLLCILNLFDISNMESYPMISCTSPKNVLEKFGKSQNVVNFLIPIMCDILTLYDTISYEAYDICSKKSGSKMEKLPITSHEKKPVHFQFIGKISSETQSGKKVGYYLSKPVLYPILGAFRHFVGKDSSNNDKAKWVWSLEEIKAFWKKNGRILLQMASHSHKENGRNFSPLRSSQSYWSAISDKVHLLKLKQEQESRDKKRIGIENPVIVEGVASS